MVDTIFLRGEGGSVFEMGLPLHETIADKLRKGHVQRVDKDGNLVPVDSDAPGLPTQRPALNAVKAEWVGWAVACGAEPDEAEALSKTDLVEKYAEAEPKQAG